MTKKKEQENQLATWDITIQVGHNDFGLDHAKVIEHLNGWCKKWVFQLEEGREDGTKHFQCRVSLIHKKRLCEILAQIPLKGHWSHTCTTVHKGQNFNYVMKADRLLGPWKDTDHIEPPVLTRQLKTFMKHEMYPWQKQVKGWCEEEDDRSIKLIYDTIGNAGKSVFVEWLEYNGMAFELPPMRHMEDIMEFCFSFRNQKVYLIDMPRAMKKDKLGDFYAGLEYLKNGVVYDKRYSGKKRRMDRPQVIVFTNVLPAWEFMSRDRWEVFEMTKYHELMPFHIE